MSGLSHSFSVDHAELYGIDAAILINHLYMLRFTSISKEYLFDVVCGYIEKERFETAIEILIKNNIVKTSSSRPGRIFLFEGGYE